MRQRQIKGAALYLFIVLVLITSYSLVRSGEIMQFTNEKSKGKQTASDIIQIIDSWSREMDARCVADSDDMDEIELDKLYLADRIRLNTLPLLDIEMSTPPAPKIEIEVSGLSTLSKKILINSLNSVGETSKVAPLITVYDDSNPRIIATRGTSAAATANYGRRSNADAVNNSVLLGGNKVYGADGC